MAQMIFTETQQLLFSTLKHYGVSTNGVICLMVALQGYEEEMLDLTEWILETNPTADEIVDKGAEIVQALAEAEDEED